MLKKYLPYLLLTLIVLIFSFSLFSNLQCPREICNDEFYYVPAGQTIWQTPNEPNLEHHPPLGKYLIGLGIKIFGNYSFGWRVIPAVFGILGLIITFFLARETLSVNRRPTTDHRSTSSQLLTTCLAGRQAYSFLLPPLLLSLDFLYFTMSRQAMLDIFVTVFILITAFCLWQYFQTQKRIFLILTGIFFGLSMASKWTAILLAPILLFLIFTRNSQGRVRQKILKSIVFEFLIVGAITAVIYLFTYTPYLMKNGVSSFFTLQKDIFIRMLYTVDSGKSGTSPFNSLFWPFFPSNTLSCYFDYGYGLPRSLSIIANPLIIWAFWLVMIYNFYRAIKNKGLSRFYILSIILSLYIPWVIVEREKYFYYMLPVMPFLVILISQTIIDLVTTKGNNFLNNSLVQKPILGQSRDVLDKIVNFLINTKYKISSSLLFQKLSTHLNSLVNNKRLIYLLITIYLLLIILLFLLYYPLLNGLPVSDHYRKTITFFWPFLF